MCLLLFRYTANILNLFYALNKNVSDVFYRMNANGIGAHYDYSPSLGRFLSRDPIEEQGDGICMCLLGANCVIAIL